MDIRDKYNLLANQPFSSELVTQVKELRDQCIITQNREYFYLCNLLLVDIYLDANNYDEALTILNKDVSDFDTATFTNIYVSYLERLIYVYINKRNFRVAYRYVFEKRKYIDNKNRQAINRWYLEMAYIYAEMNQKAKALANLQAILVNLPDEELLSHTLSNLTKLYIDEKMLKEAKQTLNDCLKVTHDEQGITYCNYLYAQICVLEEKYHDALVLYREIFNGNIDHEALSMSSDYLELLIKMKKYHDAEKFITRITPLLETSNDLDIKKSIQTKKLKLLLAQNNLTSATEILQDINKLDGEILSREELYLSDSSEDEKNNEFYLKLHDLNERIARLLSLLNIAFGEEGELRDLLLEFSQKLESLYQFDEVTFALFDKLYPYQKAEDIMIFNYKKQRLYEKVINYDNLKDTVVETMLVNGHEVAIDFTNTSLGMVDLFSGQKYVDLNVRYLLALPFSNQTGLFFTVIFKAKDFDLTNIENSLIFKIASTLLEKKITNYFLQEKLKLASLVNDTICDDSYLVYHYKDKIIVDDKLKAVLQLEHNEISKDEFVDDIIKGDMFKYQNLDFDNLNQYTIEYRLKVNQKYQKVREKLYSNIFGGEIFYVGTLKFIEEDKFTYDDERFNIKINELKSRVNNLEFKFAFIRIKARFDKIPLLKEIFNTDCYYLSDDTIVVILENEVNQRTIDKYIKSIDCPLSIVRYPRDLMNIDDIINYSKISLENNILYFTDEMYQKYLKKVSINQLVTQAIQNDLEIWYLKLINNNQKASFELRTKVNGIFNKENVRDYLDYDLLVEYDMKLFNSMKTNNNNLYFINLCSEALEKLLAANKIKYYPNLNICLDYPHKNLNAMITQLKAIGLKVYVHYRLLDNLNVLDLSSLNLDGLMIYEGLVKEKRDQLLMVAKRFNYSLLTNYEFKDYDKCIYRSEELIPGVINE